MTTQLGIPTRRGFVNVDYNEATTKDVQDCTNISAFPAKGEEAEARANMAELATALGWSATVIERQTKNGNTLFQISKRVQDSPSAIKSHLLALVPKS